MSVLFSRGGPAAVGETCSCMSVLFSRGGPAAVGETLIEITEFQLQKMTPAPNNV